MLSYEDKLNRDLAWALREGGMHFDNDSRVHRTLRDITRKLDELGIPYALAGAMCMFLQGYRRFTEDVDMVVTPDGLHRIHEQLEGRGYIRPQGSTKNLRDTESGVRIEFLITGQYPGDGKPKPVAFPDPNEAGVMIEGIRCLTLAKLIEMKIASGTTTDRLKDLADVQELIRALKIPLELAEQLDTSVRAVFIDLWRRTQHLPDEH